MKIIYVSDINIEDEGAPKIHVLEIAKGLNELNNEVTLFIPKVKKLDNRLKVNIKTHWCFKKNVAKGFSYNIVLFFSLVYNLLRAKPDVIYTRQGMSLISPALVSKLFSIPYITELNGIIEEEMKLGKNPKIFINIAIATEKFCYKIASKIIVVTSGLKKYLIKKYGTPPSKIAVLENGVDTDLFQPERLKQEYDLIFVGNLAIWQGLEYLVNAIPFVKKERGNIKLAIIGDGSEKESLIKLTKELGLEENIFVLGSKLHKEIPKYLNQSKVCIAPCILNERSKKMGISAFKIYEYASCGRPIITTRLKGVTEFINKNKCGILAEPNNPQSLADAIIKLLKNPKFAEDMGNNGRKAILNGYSWKCVAERTQKVIKDAIMNKTKYTN